MATRTSWLTKLSASSDVADTLRGAPGDVKSDREVILAAVRKSGTALQYAAEPLKADKEVVLAAVKQNGDALREADDALLADKEVVLAAVRQNGGTLIDAAPSLRDDREVVFAAVSNRGDSLAHASSTLRGDVEVVAAAAAQDVESLTFAAEALRKDKESMRRIVEVAPLALKFASAELATDPDLVTAATSSKCQNLSLKQRLEEVDDSKDPKGYDQVLGDYLLASGTSPDIPHVVDALFSHLTSLVSAGKTGQMVEALLYSIFLFSVSTSQDTIQVKTRSPGGRGPGCALVFGFGGGHFKELSGQVDFYSSLGFQVIATTPCLGPQALAERQKNALAEHLREALAEREDMSLVVHVCSNVGMGFWINLMGAWIEHKEAPWNTLPELHSILKCLVVDCAPFVPAVLDKAPSKAPPIRSLPPTDKGLEKLVPVMLGCMGGLCRQYAPHIHPIAMSQEQRFGQLLRGAAKNGSSLVAPSWPEFGDYKKWETIDVTWKPPLPRLFLHSAKDRLFPPAVIQAYVEHTKKYNPEALVLVEKCETAPHCKLWEVEQARCAAAVRTLLAKSSIIPAV